MKIAIFTPYHIFLSGGVNEHATNQAEILRKLGHDVTILTPRPRDSKSQDSPKGVVFLGGSTRMKTPSATSVDFSATLDNEAIDAELDKGYDIIHVHEPLVPIAARQLLARAEGRALRVGTFHAALPGNTIGKSLVSTYKQYAKAVLPHVDVITAVTPAAIGFIGDYTDLPINYIPNGIRSELYKYVETERDENMVFFVGRLEKRKGARQLLKAFIELKKLKPEATLKIAGTGPLTRSLTAFVKDRNIQDVEFLGYIDDETKIDYMSRCGIYTSPALYGESFGIVLAEAMAMQAPIVAHPNDGYSWVLQETGRISLVDCKDPVEYAQRMQLMMEDDGIRKAWQKWAKEYVKQFDYNKIVATYDKLYKDNLK
ncbi:MAG: phosphatidylinositol alpha-mannosyltransferase [Candidatus Saccharimonadales bacterium]|jgi:phosphatidylinositol alpha-mannosyltransferase